MMKQKLATTASLVLVLAATARGDPEEIGNRRTEEVLLAGVARSDPEIGSKAQKRRTQTNFCAPARCGTSWVEANFKCGVNCEAWNGPDWVDVWCETGEQCWADLDVSLPCCEDPTVERTSAPAPAPPPSNCSTVRCGTDWANANSKCGMECMPYNPDTAEEYVDLCVPFGETCYADLDDTLSCCYEEPTETTFAPILPPAPAPTLRPTQGPMSDPTPEPMSPPTSPPASMGLDTPVQLDQLFPDQPGSYCSPVRCGTDWTDANFKCGTECLPYTPEGEYVDICVPFGETCFADLDVTLECCSNEPDGTPPAPVPAPPPNFCTTARCGTSWAEANFKCGVNCKEWNGPDWVDVWCATGEECWADLDVSLPCCEDPTVVRTSAPAPAPPPSNCSTVRCGTDWSNANSKCGMECLPYNPDTAEEYVDLCVPFGETCYADLDDTLSCCYEEPTETTFAPILPPSPAPTLRPTQGPMSEPSPKPMTPPVSPPTPRPTLRPAGFSPPTTTVATDPPAPFTTAPLPILQPNPRPTPRPTGASPPATTVATEPPAILTAAPLPILQPNPRPVEPPVLLILTGAPVSAPQVQLPGPSQQTSMDPTQSLAPSASQPPTLSQQPSGSRSPSRLLTVEPTVSLKPSVVPSLQQTTSEKPVLDIIESNITMSSAPPSGAPSQQPSSQVFADSSSGNSAATSNGSGEDNKSAGKIAGYAAIGVGVVAAIAVIAILASKRQQRKVETDQAQETAASPLPILVQQPVSDVTNTDAVG